jgi:hypothetical protein
MTDPLAEFNSEPAVCPGCHQPAVFGNGETAIRVGHTRWNIDGDVLEHDEEWWHETCYDQGRW